MYIISYEVYIIYYRAQEIYLSALSLGEVFQRRGEWPGEQITTTTTTNNKQASNAKQNRILDILMCMGCCVDLRILIGMGGGVDLRILLGMGGGVELRSIEFLFIWGVV